MDFQPAEPAESTGVSFTRTESQYGYWWEGGIGTAEGVTECGRRITWNSCRWICACGGSGRLGRDADGMPYVDDDVLRHQPGETKES